MDAHHQAPVCPSEQLLSITLESQADEGQLSFAVSPQLAVGAFLKQILGKLAEEGHRERINTMLECYEPVLELCHDNGAVSALHSSMALAQAGVTDGAICRISGRPRKEKVMFCRHS